MSASDIDWNLIKNLDPVEIKKNKDSKSIHAVIKSICASFILSDQEFLTNPLTPKLIQLLQISIQYLMSIQKKLSNNIEIKNNEYIALQKKYLKIDNSYRQLLLINEKLRKPREVCPTCGKKFKIGYLDQHFRLRHPELIDPWNKIREKSVTNQNNEKDNTNSSKSKEKRKKLKINKCSTVQISPKNKEESKALKDDQISLNQGQIDQMVDEISKRISKHIQVSKDKNPPENANKDFKRESPPREQHQFDLDARRHDQSESHQQYVEQNAKNEFGDGGNSILNSPKKNTGSRVIFDPTAVENHYGTKGRNRNFNESVDYDYDEYNEDYLNDDIRNSPSKNESKNVSNNVINNKDQLQNPVNEFDDFLMGSSDVALSNQKNQKKLPEVKSENHENRAAQKVQQEKQAAKVTQPQQQQQKPIMKKPASTQNQPPQIKDEFDEFMIESSEIASANRQSKPTMQQQQNTNPQPQQKPKQSQNPQQKQTQIQKQQKQPQNQQPQKQTQNKQQQKQSQVQQQQKQTQIQKQQKQPQNQQQQKQTQNQFQQQRKQQTQQQQQNKPQGKQKQSTNNQTASKQQNRQLESSPYQNKIDQSRSNDEFNEDFDEFMLESSEIANQKEQPKSSNKVPQKEEQITPQQYPVKLYQSSASFPPSPGGPSSSASFPPSPTSPHPAKRTIQKSSGSKRTDNSDFQFTDDDENTSNYRQSRVDEDENEEFREFMIQDDEKQQLKELPKPPKREILPNNDYIAITNDELNELIQESSSILNENDNNNNNNANKKKASKPAPKKTTVFTNDELDALIPESSELIEEREKKNSSPKRTQTAQKTKSQFKMPPQYANYSPSELEVILAEESSAMDHDKNSQSNYNYNDDIYNYNDDVYMKQNFNKNKPYNDNYDDNDNYNDDVYMKQSSNKNKPYNDNYDDNDNYNDDIFMKQSSNKNKPYNDNYDDNYNNYYDDDNYHNDNYSSSKYQTNTNLNKPPPKSQAAETKPPMSIAEARKMAKNKKKSQQITTIGGIEFTDSQLAGFL